MYNEENPNKGCTGYDVHSFTKKKQKMVHDSILMSKVQIADKGAEQTQQYEGEVPIASDTKRKVSRPKYLKDYVWEPEVPEDGAARSCLGSSLTV